ncbi:MAG: hypothetical protein M3156_08200, partial [Thermoproteota archaeon]|nr:hypothetical protein [Thermoproteota archaeon]
MLHRSKLKIVLSIIFVFTTMNVLLISQHPVMAQQQQQQNSTVVDVMPAKDNESSLSLNSIFKEVENSVVQITRKVP